MEMVDPGYQFNRPLLHLLEDTEVSKSEYLRLCVSLHKAALKGDWKAARHILENDWTLVRSAITMGWATILHVAAGANRLHFVEELVKLMEPRDLELQDIKRNTAFFYAAATGNVQIVDIMQRKNPTLALIRGEDGFTPLHMAALRGRGEMAWYLYPKTVELFEHADWIMLFFSCVKTGLYDLAKELLREKPELAFATDDNNGTALQILARKPLGSINRSQRYRKVKSDLKLTQQLQLVKCLWDRILARDPRENIMELIRNPSHVIFTATEVGNFEFLAEILGTFPDLIWEVDDRNRSIIHVAVLHRHASIFNLIHDIGPLKDFLISFLDHEDNNLLHLAAKLAPPDRLNIVSGAAFQMMLELLWFEEVKQIMPPAFIEMKNSEGMTPCQLFTKEHKELLNEAESWMKGTANSCIVVSTLIATGVFTAAFSVPGGYNDSTGTPNYLEKSSFLVFAISDATALITSSASILIFLSVLLVSRYTEDDFYKSLPLKLIFGLVTLFVSIISMMTAFSSAFFITYYHGLMWGSELHFCTCICTHTHVCISAIAPLV